MTIKLFARKSARKFEGHRTGGDVPSNGRSSSGNHGSPRSTSDDTDPLHRMFLDGRFSAILSERERCSARPGGRDIIARAESALERRMALVPSGSVTLCQTLSATLGAEEHEFGVEAFLLDVHAVSNERFQKFVDGGGYDALAYWPEEIWPHLIELKDQTGQPGPRCWRDGHYPPHLADHPVVGVSWYEAQAFALWIGQRLATETEWEMAASWHIRSSTDCVRRFPWGDEMDRTRCNVWSSGRGSTVPVSAYPTGAAPNQVRQLVGNVWEWTDSEFSVTDDDGQPIVGEMPMRVVRGGAFDTYFDSQATSAFRSGQLVLARPHNTGFRCAMNLDDAGWLRAEEPPA